MTNTDTSAEAVERLADQLRGEGDAHFRGSIRDRGTVAAIMCAGGDALRALLAERDQLQAQVEKACRLAEAVSKQTAGNGTQVISPETAAALADFNKARGEG